MEFLFECSTWYLNSERSERVRYKVKHEKRNSIFTSSHVLFCVLYKHNIDNFFVDLPKTSEHFPNISEDSPKSPKARQTFSNISSRLLKMSEDNRRFPSNNRWSNTSKYFLRDFVTKIPCLHANVHWYFTVVYILTIINLKPSFRIPNPNNILFRCRCGARGGDLFFRVYELEFYRKYSWGWGAGIIFL